METPLLQTKFHIPTLRPEWVPRPRLFERLNAGFDSGKLTLVSAPPGFGKTTCIGEWVNRLGYPVAWLSLDSADDDPGCFFAYLVAALRKIDPNLGREIEGVLRAGQLPPGKVISATLINDILARSDRFLLVLDDFQVIQERFILEVLADLVSNLPQSLHLVLITREDPPLPLARLRANNQLVEIRAEDLRFTGDEARLFLNEMMGLPLSQADVTILEDKTEGWVAGLQLAGLSIRNQASASEFIASLSGSHRFILNYLTEEVLNRQPEEIRRFLLQTSILDRLNGDLCDAVTGRADGRTMLERLFNANLFLIALDDEGQWYRYHQLFADLLRDLLNVHHQDEAPELHRRASRWYAQAGLVSEAIQHTIVAKDYEMAVNLLEHHAMRMIMQGYARTVNDWVQAIPEKWALQSPRTNLAFAWMHLLRGDYAQTPPYLERLQASLGDFQTGHRSEENASLRAEWLVMQSLISYYKPGYAGEGIAMVTQALEIAPEQDSRVRSLVYWGLAGFYELMGDYAHAVEAYQASIQHGRAAENLVAEMMSTAGLADMAFQHGQLQLASEIAAATSARVERSGSLPPICAVLYGVFGEVYYQWLRIEPARRHTLRALQLSTLGGYNTGVISCHILLSRLAQIEGDLDAAAREIQQAVEMSPVEVVDYAQQEMVSQQVRVYLGQKRLAAAQMVLQGHGFSFQDQCHFPALPPDQNLTHAMGLLYNSSLHVLLYQARAGQEPTGLTSGIELADRLVAKALQDRYIPVALEALLLRAQMHTLLGDHPASQADYIHALELAEPEGFIGVFVEQGLPVAEAIANLVKQNRLVSVQPDYVERILAAFPSSQSSGLARSKSSETTTLFEPAVLFEPLTDREMDVLYLMADGLKYKEIAARLFISLNTVRFHVKAIYGKLGVNNRTQAIEVAHQLRIL
jgi:LuxR family maltose regulon positive regulatory protein